MPANPGGREEGGRREEGGGRREGEGGERKEGGVKGRRERGKVVSCLEQLTAGFTSPNPS